MKDFEASPPADDVLDPALKAYARHFARARPAPGLVDAICTGVLALQSGSPPPELREFLQVVATDAALQDQLARVADRGAFVRLLTAAGAARGFPFLSGEVYALFRRCEAANDGELDDEQLDAVAAAAQDNLQWMWQMFRDKP